MYTVYSLVDPRYSLVRYIGITEDVYSRFSQHLRCEENNIDKNEWVQEMRRANVMIVMLSLETAETWEEAREREDYWIHHHLLQGAHLLNRQVACSFSYEDFLAAFGKPQAIPDQEPVKRVRPRGPIALRRGASIPVEQVAEVIGRTPRKVRNLIKSGDLSVTPRNKNLVFVSSVNAYLSSIGMEEIA